MLLAVDIGNTSITMGIFADGGLLTHKIKTHPVLSPSGYAKVFKDFLREKGIDKQPRAGVISSVVPGHTGPVSESIRTITGREPVLAGFDKANGLRFEVLHPEEVGADRVAAAVAAKELYGVPIAVLDFGTATTVSFVAKGNVYKGGAILPGIGLMSRSLSTGTAKLPEVGFFSVTDIRPVGRDTASSITSGIILGTAGAVERIISEAEASEGETFKVVATGGNMKLIFPYLKRADFTEPALVIKGLKFIYEAYGNA